MHCKQGYEPCTNAGLDYEAWIIAGKQQPVNANIVTNNLMLTLRR